MSEITTEQMIEWIDMWFFEEPDLSMLKAIRSRLSDYDALKAEVESESARNKILADEVNAWAERAKKAEAETVTLKQEISGNDAAHRLVEAALAEARPLLDAVMGDGTATTSARHPVVIDAWAACVLEFALAYRAGRTK